jgi:hypothetical protein
MRKNRFVLSGTEKTLYTSIVSTPLSFFQSLEQIGTAIPSWCAVILLAARPEFKLDISYFENAADFFLWYSKISLSREEMERVAAFIQEKNNWVVFDPPTLIGVDLRTKLR